MEFSLTKEQRDIKRASAECAQGGFSSEKAILEMVINCLAGLFCRGSESFRKAFSSALKAPCPIHSHFFFQVF